MTAVLNHARKLWDFLTEDRGHQPSDLIVVCGSYDLRVCVRWPGIAAWVDAPLLHVPWEGSNLVGVFGLIEEMVGDIHRHQIYPGLGFQVPLQMPEDVLGSWQFLVNAGFDRHLFRQHGLGPVEAGPRHGPDERGINC